MNLEAALLKEHSKKQCAGLVKYIGADKKKFALLITLFLKGEYRITQRAAWPISYCIEAHPGFIGPYYKKIVQLLKRNDVHPSVTRNILRLLQYVKIPKRWQGEIMNSCFQFISDPQGAAAAKAFSLTILENLLKIYPEILPELILVIEERWNTETPAFKARAKKILLKKV